MVEIRLYKKYKEEVMDALAKEFGLKNKMQIPTVKKVVVNAGIGPFKDSREAIELFVSELTAITGQKPAERKSRKSIAGFKIRQNDVVGYTVTLRGVRMWAFLDKLANIVLPRVRDFNGLSVTAFDEAGNYSLGIREHTIFPEVNANVTKGIRSMQVNIVTQSGNKELSKKLLSHLGMPFKETK